jgi:hypothetical protein
MPEEVPVSEIEAQPSLRYRLLTGPDDRAFCEKVSAALDEGYELYGSPSISKGADGVVSCAQAVIRRTP